MRVIYVPTDRWTKWPLKWIWNYMKWIGTWYCINCSRTSSKELTSNGPCALFNPWLMSIPPPCDEFCPCILPGNEVLRRYFDGDVTIHCGWFWAKADIDMPGLGDVGFRLFGILFDIGFKFGTDRPRFHGCIGCWCWCWCCIWGACWCWACCCDHATLFGWFDHTG